MGDEKYIDIISLWRTLWKWRYWLIISFLGPAIVAMIISLLLPKSYTSYVKILTPEVASGGSLASGPFGAITGLGVKGVSISSQAVMALLQSNRMSMDVVDRFKIKDLYKIKNDEDAIEFLKKNLVKIEIDENEGTISIFVTTRWPKLSRDIADFYVKNLYRLNEELKLTYHTPIVKVLDPPFVPRKKSSPKVKKNMAIAGILGLVLGLIYVYLNEKLKNVRSG